MAAMAQVPAADPPGPELPPLTPENINMDTVPTVPLNGERFGPQTRTPAAVAEGVNLLARVARTYREAPALKDTVVYSLSLPGGQPQGESFTVECAGDACRATSPQVAAVALGGKVFITLPGVDDKYVEEPYTGSAALGLAASFAMLPTPDLLLRGGVQPPALAFGLLALDEPRLEAYRPGEFLFSGKQGDVSVRVDPTTALLTSASLVFTPPGTPEVIRIRVEFTFAPEILPELSVPIAFDAAMRARVASAEELAGQVPALRVGDVAPEFAAPALDGTPISSKSLPGRFIVLEFWSTWCGPCKRGLPILGEFATWASANAPDVAVFGVNVWEEGAPDEVPARVRAYWAKGGFPFPTLLGTEDMAKSFAITGIPATVVIDRGGRIAAVHVGVEPDLGRKLREMALMASPVAP